MNMKPISLFKRTLLSSLFFAAVQTRDTVQAFCLLNPCLTTRSTEAEAPLVVVLRSRNSDREDVAPASTAANPSQTSRVIRQVLDQMKGSPVIREKHEEHVQSDVAFHLFKGSFLVNMPDSLKLLFVNSWAGLAVETIMKEEQEYLGDWKTEKIIQAAGDYDRDEVRSRIAQDISQYDIFMYSFADCPWCLAAKKLLLEEDVPSSFGVVEIDEIGRSGKWIRAELASQTGRTSMPCIFVKGTPIGGFTDGLPVGTGLKELHRSGKLFQMLTATKL